MTRFALSALAVLSLAVGGCASTTTSQISPSPQEPVCAASTTTNADPVAAKVARRPRRTHPTEKPQRPSGFGQFFESSGCFKSAALQRLAQNADDFALAAAAEAANRQPKVVLITVRELGPTVKIGASLALVESYMPFSCGRRHRHLTAIAALNG